MLHRTRRPRAALPRTKGNPRRRPLGLHIIRDLDRAYSLLHPVRRRILEMLSEPESSAGISHRLKLPRQKVNYHVKEMARTRLLLPAGRKRKRRFYEQCYVASAKAYVLSPELLGKLAADAGTMPDRLSAGHLQGLAAQMQKEVNRAMDLTPGGKKVATLSLNREVRFTSAEQRAGFTRALEKAIVDVVGKHTSPFQLKDGSPAPGGRSALFWGAIRLRRRRRKHGGGRTILPLSRAAGRTWRFRFQEAEMTEERKKLLDHKGRIRACCLRQLFQKKAQGSSEHRRPRFQK